MWGRRAPANGDAAAIALARELEATTRADLARADDKASTLLAGSLVALGIVGSALVTGQWSPWRMQPVPAALWGLALLIALVGLALLLAVIYPRRSPESGHHRLGYFDHIRTAGDLAGALRARAAGQELHHRAAMLATIAGIAGRKMSLLRWSIRLLTTAAAVAVVAGLASWAGA